MKPAVVCAACAAPLRRPPAMVPALPDPFPCCDAVRCRMLISRRAEVGDAGLRHLLQLRARQSAEHRQAEQGLQDRRDREQHENAACQAALLPTLEARLAAAAAPAVAAKDVLHLVLPSGPRRERPLSHRRRERYRRHLQHGLAQVTSAALAASTTPSPIQAPAADAGADPAAAVPGPAWAGSLCGVCRGGCCTRGGDTAYLGTQTLQRYLQQHPQMSPEAVLAQYLSHLPAASMAGSCIHHTRQGCSLPREMRSQTCNQFRCGPLALLQAPPQPVQAVVVIQRRQSLWCLDDPALDNRITATTLLRAEGTVALRPRQPKPAPD